ncbi:hypothetical protein PspLS_06989 [Pyricularia sp. CBS 133598]|nr:hypothetical protein PspLS_06989 [Pyricularia sp. CBS 133598]
MCIGAADDGFVVTFGVSGEQTRSDRGTGLDCDPSQFGVARDAWVDEREAVAHASVSQDQVVPAYIMKVLGVLHEPHEVRW